MSKTERQLAELIMDADLPKRLQEEIVRLRSEIAERFDVAHLDAAEIARLRAELADKIEAYGQASDALEAADDEIARLREALTEIKKACAHYDNDQLDAHEAIALIEHEIDTRAALAPRPRQTEDHR